MTSGVRKLWRDQKLLVLAFVVALVVVVFFTGRMAASWIYWADPAHHNVEIRSWMTPGYVAKSYHMPPQPMFAALDYQPIPGQPRSLKDIADETGRPVSELIATLQAAIIAFRANPPAPVAP